jgi:two-component system response regulator RegA
LIKLCARSANIPRAEPVALKNRTILIVDDDRALRERLSQALRDRGLRVRSASSGTEALALAKSSAPDLAVIDLRMPDGSGLDLVRDLRALCPGTRVLVLTGYGSIATAIEAIRIGAANYLPKPADADDILAAFEIGTSAPAESADTPACAPSLARVEWEHIQRVLADCGGNISEAARRLGIHRRSLQRKLQKYPPNY